MPDLELTRSSDDRRRCEVAGVGTLRLEGLLSRAHLAEDSASAAGGAAAASTAATG